MKNILLAISVFLLSIPAFAAEHEVKMLNNGAGGMMIFEPAVLKASVGDTVKFVATLLWILCVRYVLINLEIMV